MTAGRAGRALSADMSKMSRQEIERRLRDLEIEVTEDGYERLGCLLQLIRTASEHEVEHLLLDHCIDWAIIVRNEAKKEMLKRKIREN